MILMKHNLIFSCLVLCYILSLSIAIECRKCKLDDPPCLFAQDAAIDHCEYDDDLCYSWFYRNGSDVGVIRGCISIASPEYSLIKEVIGSRNSGCVKRIRGLDCFSFCATSLCN